MRKRKGALGTIMGILSVLSLIGIFLAVLTQFGGDLGALIQWLMTTAWNFVITIKDTIANWPTFQRLF